MEMRLYYSITRYIYPAHVGGGDHCMLQKNKLDLVIYGGSAQENRLPLSFSLESTMFISVMLCLFEHIIRLATICTGTSYSIITLNKNSKQKMWPSILDQVTPVVLLS